MRNRYLKYPLLLLVLSLFLFIAGAVADSSMNLEINQLDIFNITISFAIVSLAAMIIFFRGLSREPREQTMHTFTAVGIKFIAELFIALIWFVVAKKTSTECIILFLLLYLAFSLYLMWVIINSLKNNSL